MLCKGSLKLPQKEQAETDPVVEFESQKQLHYYAGKSLEKKDGSI